MLGETRAELLATNAQERQIHRYQSYFGSTYLTHAADRYDLARGALDLAEPRPGLHKLPPLLEQITRRYAASTLFSIVCAKAISTTSRGKFVRSAAQSRKLDRKPCAVRSSRPCA